LRALLRDYSAGHRLGHDLFAPGLPTGVQAKETLPLSASPDAISLNNWLANSHQKATN